MNHKKYGLMFAIWIIVSFLVAAVMRLAGLTDDFFFWWGIIAVLLLPALIVHGVLKDFGIKGAVAWFLMVVIYAPLLWATLPLIYDKFMAPVPLTAEALNERLNNADARGADELRPSDTGVIIISARVRNELIEDVNQRFEWSLAQDRDDPNLSPAEKQGRAAFHLRNAQLELAKIDKIRLSDSGQPAAKGAVISEGLRDFGKTYALWIVIGVVVLVLIVILLKKKGGEISGISISMKQIAVVVLIAIGLWIFLPRIIEAWPLRGGPKMQELDGRRAPANLQGGDWEKVVDLKLDPKVESQDTKFVAEPGDELYIMAEGTVKCDPHWKQSVSLDGTTITESGLTFVCPEALMGQLLVMTPGEVRPVGTRRQITVQNGGPIFIGINDLVGWYGDNTESGTRIMILRKKRDGPKLSARAEQQRASHLTDGSLFSIYIGIS